MKKQKKINSRIRTILKANIEQLSKTNQFNYKFDATDLTAQEDVEYYFSNMFEDIKRYKKQSYVKKKDFRVCQKASMLILTFFNSDNITEEERDALEDWRIDLLPEDVDDDEEKFIDHYINSLNNIIIRK